MGQKFINYNRGEERLHFMALVFLWEFTGGWRRMENVLSLSVQLKRPTTVCWPSHEERPLQSPLLNSWPEVWHLSLERAQMGMFNSSIYEVTS